MKYHLMTAAVSAFEISVECPTSRSRATCETRAPQRQRYAFKGEQQ